MGLFKPSTTRRMEVRKAMPRKRGMVRRVLTRSEAIWGFLIVFIFLLLVGMVVVEGRQEPPYRPGQLVDRTRISRVKFNALDKTKTEEARKTRADLEPAVYTLNEQFLNGAASRLKSLPTLAAGVEFSKLSDDVQKSFSLSPEAYETLKGYVVDNQPDDQWVQWVDMLVAELRKQANLLDTERFQVERQNVSRSIRVVPEGRVISDAAVYNIADEEGVRSALDEAMKRFPAPVREPVVTYFVRAKEPTVRHDPLATEQAKTQAARDVPERLTKYEPNNVLVYGGEVLTADGYKLLGDERDEYLRSLPRWVSFSYHAAPLMLVGLVVASMVVCVAALRPRVATNPMRGLALSALLLSMLALAWVCRPMHEHAAAAAAIAPAVLAAIIVTIAYDQRLAIALAALQAMLIGLTLRSGLGIYIVTFFACITAVIQLGEVRKRGRLTRAGFVTGLVAAAGVVAVGLSDRQYVPGGAAEIGTLAVSAYEALTTFIAVFLAGVFVLGSLPFIERAFKVSTSMTLLELADMDHPLLRRLSESAPGTFNHSLQVATLAEAGADAIGANGLLARVGAYYHDIGKVHKPGYFVENQSGGPNRHDKLSPAMSLLIIVAHVKDGVEMAREYGLPPVLHHFIEAHHGTTLVEYFYHAAKRTRDETQQPEEVEFRYPGPKPQTREVAVVMICDAVESACRALAEPTPGRIEQLVHKLTGKRLLDGQFDECDITLNELRQVEEAVTKALNSIYHGRIAYPDPRKSDKPADKGERQPVAVALEERIAS